MSAVRSRGNRSTELRLIAVLRAHGLTGWRRGSRLTGRPDFVFRARRLAVFVDGCFWHGPPSPRLRRGNLPAPRDPTENQRRLLAEENLRQPHPRPPRHPHAPRDGLARPPRVGA